MGILSVVDYIEYFKKREISFSLLKKQLPEFDLPTSNGWDGLQAHLVQLERDNRRQVIDALHQIFLMNIYYGNRAVSFYDMARDALINSDDVVDFFRSVEPRQGPYGQCYPFPLDYPELKAAAGIVVAEVKDDGDHIKVVFCTKRKFSERVRIGAGDFNDPDARDIIDGFAEVIGVRSGLAQAYDAIWLNKNTGRIILHVDLIVPLNKDQIGAVVNKLVRFVNFGLRTKYRTPKVYVDAKNVFPKIQQLYGRNDCVVNKLSHSTSTGSVKAEKMRRKLNDLRSETFHASGYNAISGVTSPYAISVVWPNFNPPYLPEVTIQGSLHDAGSQIAEVGHAVVNGCVRERDFLMIESILT